MPRRPRRQSFFPHGDLSFADEVVSFEPGKPAAANERNRDPEHALGVLDYDESGTQTI